MILIIDKIRSNSYFYFIIYLNKNYIKFYLLIFFAVFLKV